MSDEAKPVEQTPDAAPAAEAPVEEPAETTPAPAAAETAAPEAESKPTEEAPVTTEDKPAEAAETAAPTAPAEEKAAPKEAEPIYSGDLNFKGPANFPRNLFRQKTHFWFGEDEAVPTSKLGNFLKDSKAEHAHPAAAWSSQTGKGLLYYAKHKKDKEHPTGIILLIDVVDISPAGTNEITFKVYGQKHTFITASEREREGWLKAIKAEIEAAKGKKEEIQGSEGYKKTLEELKPAAAGAGAAGAATNAKKSEERATREENGTTKSKSRSVSRGKRGSLFDRFSGKKEEAKEEAKDDKKEEAAKDAEAPADETAQDAPTETPAATVEEPKKEEPKKEEVKAEEPKKADEPKTSRRTSKIITDLFKGKGPAQEKKSAEPAAAPVKEEAPKTEDKPEGQPAEAAAPVAATEEVKKEEPKETPTPKAERKNFLDMLRPKDKAKSPTTESAPKETEPAKPAEEAAEAPAATEATAEAEPATKSGDAPAVDGDAKETPARPSAETKDKEKRRSSLFPADLAGSLKKIGHKAEKAAEPEKKAETNGEPAKDKPASTPVSKKEKEHKESPMAKLSRRFSTAIRIGNKKEAPAPPKAEETGESAEANKAEEAPKTEETKPVEETKPAEGEKPVSAIGDVVAEAVNVGSAPPASATVSATA